MTIDTIAAISAISSAIAAVAAALAIWFSMRERQSDMKEDFVLWAIERLRDPANRKGRRLIYSLTDADWQALENAARARSQDTRLDEIRLVCLAFDEIGYFIYKVGLVDFRDILDMYPQTVRIWNKMYPLIKTWRELENASSFIYFEMLARQVKLKVEPIFDEPTPLHRD